MLEKLLKRKARLHRKMQRMLDEAEQEGRGLTEKEDKKYAEFEREFDEVSKSLELAKKQEERKKKLDALKTPPLFAGSNTKTEEQREDEKVDVQHYSLFRAIQAQVTGDWSKAEYERDCSIKIADELGREAKGLFIPYEVQRAVLTTANSSALVGTEHRDDMFIESLQADSIVMSMGAQLLTGLVGNVDIPKALGGVVMDWIGEDSDAPATDANFGTVALTPRTIAGAIAISRKLLKQSSPSIERMLEADLRKGMALGIDIAVIAGTGADNQPLGIMNTTGVNTQAIADATNYVPTFAEAVGFETALADDNALRGSLSYLTTPKINGLTKTQPIDAGSGIFLNQDNKMNGYTVKGSSLVPQKFQIP